MSTSESLPSPTPPSHLPRIFLIGGILAGAILCWMVGVWVVTEGLPRLRGAAQAEEDRLKAERLTREAKSLEKAAKAAEEFQEKQELLKTQFRGRN